MAFTAKVDIRDPGLSVSMLTRENMRVSALEFTDFKTVPPIRAGQRTELTLLLETLPLLHGTYQLELQLKDVAASKVELVPEVFPFDVVETPVYGGRKIDPGLGSLDSRSDRRFACRVHKTTKTRSNAVREQHDAQARLATRTGHARRRVMRTFWTALSVTTVILLMCFRSVGAAQPTTLTLAWHANNERDLAGYLVWWGTSSCRYTNSIDIGKLTVFPLHGAGPHQGVLLRPYRHTTPLAWSASFRSRSSRYPASTMTSMATERATDTLGDARVAVPIHREPEILVLDGAILARSVEHALASWHQRLADFPPPIELPGARTRPQFPGGTRAQVFRLLSPTLVAGAHETGDRARFRPDGNLVLVGGMRGRSFARRNQ